MAPDELRRRLAELSALAAGADDVARRMPAGDVMDEFAVAQRARGYSETTVRTRLSALRHLQKLSGAPLLEVDRSTITAFLGRTGITASTRRVYKTSLEAFYRWALSHEYVIADPTAALGAIRTPRTVPRPFTPGQVEQLLTSGAYGRTRAMMLLGYYQGFRVSQIARVHGHDIDLEAQTIRTIGKGGKDRLLPLHPVIAELARRMPRDGFWFPARGGRPGHVHPSAVTNLVARARKRAGIQDERLTAHSLRHSFATHLVDAGIDIRVIQELMLHESLSTTQIYAGVSERLKKRGIEALAARDVPLRSNRKTSFQSTPPKAA